MSKKLLAKIKPFLKSLLVITIAVALIFGNANNALAARSGGRMGGGSFRMPSRTLPSSGGGLRTPGGGIGGGIGFPFLLPFFGFGGFGSLFTILIFMAVANFLIQNFRRVGGDENNLGYGNSSISVAKVQVGLFANARTLQTELNEIANTADTDTNEGRATLLQEASLALLRHPEYWVYGATESQIAPLQIAEAKFNQLTLAERSKFTSETLSNVNNQLRKSASTSLLVGKTELPILDESGGKYIIVTIVVGTQGKLELPKINDEQNLRQALQQIGGIGSDNLLAVEVLWTPQAEGDTLSKDDIFAEYPNLQLV